MSEQRWEAVVGARPGGAVADRVPFDANEAWGAKDRYYVTAAST
jgi:hypothetical protein